MRTKVEAQRLRKSGYSYLSSQHLVKATERSASLLEGEWVFAACSPVSSLVLDFYVCLPAQGIQSGVCACASVQRG